jgi:hypothetical protein
MRFGIAATLFGLAVSASLAGAETPAGTPAGVEFHDTPTVSGCTACGDMCLAQPCCGPQLTLRADYLLWWIKDGPLPQPLVTTGTPASEGILGNQGTAVLIGASDVDYGVFQGGRLSADYWLDSCTALQASIFILEQRSDISGAGSDAAGSPVLTRPVYNVLAGQETGSSVAFPNAFRGNVAVVTSSQAWGGELNMLSNWSNDGCRRIDIILGGRYLELQESLYIHHDSTILEQGIAGFEGAVLLAPSRLGINDGFETQNRFYGGQIGAQAQFQRGMFTIDVAGKVAFGWSRQVISITGSTTLFEGPGPVAVANGGLLAVPTNIGRHEDDVFAIVPELNVSVSYPIRENITARLGYTFLYWSDVVRPGEQVNRAVNPQQVPSSLAFGPLTGPAQPVNPFSTTDFWAMGLSLGLEIRY